MPESKLPRLRLGTIDKTHDRAVESMGRFSGRYLTREICKPLAMSFSLLLNSEETPDIYGTLVQYEGMMLTPEWIDLVSRQLVARKEELGGGPLRLFERPIRDEWVPLEVYSIKPCVWRDNDPGQMLQFYCLAGHPAGHHLQKKLPERFLSYMAYKIGFSRRIQFDHDPLQMIGLRFWGYLLADTEESSDLSFENWDVSNDVLKHNRTIIKLRNRFELDTEDDTCPFALDHYCSECPRSVNECPAAIHRERYARGHIVDDPTAGAGQPS